MPRWIHRLLHNDAVDKQLDAELQFHLEQQIADNIEAGMTPEEARRRAQIEIGGVEQVKQICRDAHWENFLGNIVRDFRFALRSLNKDRRFAFTAIFTLAIGIGAATVTFSVFYNLLFNAFAAKDADRLAVPSIEQSWGEVFPLTRSFATFEAIRQQNHTFEDIVAYFHRFALLSFGGKIRQFHIAYVTPNAFEFYGVPSFLGRGIGSADGKSAAPPVFVMGYKTWIADFNADPNILGKSFTVDGESRTLVGVMPPRFQAYGADEQLWAPITPDAPTSLSLRPDIFLLGRLRPGVSLNVASADLDVVLQRLASVEPNNFPKHFTARVKSAIDCFLGPGGIGTSDDLVFNLKHLLYSLLAAGVMLLLISCANVGNLMLARATVREKEIAVRVALGATRGRLIRQLLVESFVLALAGCAMGCAFGSLGTKAVSTLVPQKGIAVGGEAVIGLDRQALLFALSITVLTTVICGLVPGFHAVRRNLQPQLGGSSKGVSGAFRHGRLRSGLVISEVALSIVLMIGATLMLRSFFLITHVDLGFNPDKLILAAFGYPKESHSTPAQSEALLQAAMQRLKALPGISEVAINNSLPGYNGGFESEVVSPTTQYSERAKVDRCGEAALRTLGMHLIRGRWFSPAEVDSERQVATINATLARRAFGDQDPIGQRLEVKAFGEGSPTSKSHFFEIVGVVKDIKNEGPGRPTISQVFIPNREGGILFIRTKADPASMMRTIQEQIWAIDKNVVFPDFMTLKDQLYTLTYSAPEFGLAALASLASIALLLVLVGIFSVMAYTVSLQTHDIGIRLALGAQQVDILRMVLKKGLALITIGIVIGVLVSLGLTRFLSSQLWGVSPTDPWTFATVVVGILVVGLAACFLPARRATQVDPVVTLRYE